MPQLCILGKGGLQNRSLKSCLIISSTYSTPGFRVSDTFISPHRHLVMLARLLFRKRYVLRHTAASPGAHTSECLESDGFHWKTLEDVGRCCGRRANPPRGMVEDVISSSKLQNI